MRLAKRIEFLLYTAVHRVAAGCQCTQKGQVHIFHFPALHQQLDERGCADNVIGTIGSHQLADGGRDELGYGNQRLAQAQRHMHTAHHAIGRKNRDNAKVTSPILPDNVAVGKIHNHSIHGIIGEHHALWQTGGTAGIGDSNSCIANIRRFLRHGIFAVLYKNRPLDYFIAIGNVGPGCQCFKKLLERRQ